MPTKDKLERELEKSSRRQPPERCNICGDKIIGKKFRAGQRGTKTLWACNRCNNERPGV